MRSRNKSRCRGWSSKPSGPTKVLFRTAPVITTMAVTAALALTAVTMAVLVAVLPTAIMVARTTSAPPSLTLHHQPTRPTTATTTLMPTTTRTKSRRFLHICLTNKSLHMHPTVQWCTRQQSVAQACPPQQPDYPPVITTTTTTSTMSSTTTTAPATSSTATAPVVPNQQKRLVLKLYKCSMGPKNITHRQVVHLKRSHMEEPMGMPIIMNKSLAGNDRIIPRKEVLSTSK